jgi:addiction module RelE/StbE family toxin
MKALFHKDFKKHYKKLSLNTRKKTDERLLLFLSDPFAPILNNHALRGKYTGHRSINITGDIRAIYELAKEDVAYFIEIDTPSNLYK